MPPPVDLEPIFFSFRQAAHWPTLHKNSTSESGLRIRIRVNFSSWIRIRIQYADPVQGGKNLKKKLKKCTEIGSNCKLIFWGGKFEPAPWFFTFEQYLSFFFQLQNTLHKVIYFKFVPVWIRIRIEKNSWIRDPQKKNEDPQPRSQQWKIYLRDWLDDQCYNEDSS